MTLTDPQYKALLDAEAIALDFTDERSVRYEAMDLAARIREFIKRVGKVNTPFQEDAAMPF